MLVTRIARYAARHGIPLLRQLETIRLGLAGTVRVTTPIHLAYTQKARAQLEAVGLALTHHLTEENKWVELRGGTDGVDAFDDFLAHGTLPARCSLLLSTAEWRVRCVPDGTYLRVVDVVPAWRRPRGSVFLLAEFTEEPVAGFDAVALVRIVAASDRTKTLTPTANARGEEVEERRFLQAHRSYVEDVEAHLRTTTPAAPYRIVTHAPLRLATDGFWPRPFTQPEARIQLQTTDGKARTFIVAGYDEEAEQVTLEGDAGEVALDHIGTATIRPTVAPLQRMRDALGELANGVHESHLDLLEVLCRPTTLRPFDRPTVQHHGLGAMTAETERQHQALTMAAACPDACIVHGPPGTGKTTVICELILQLLARGQRILLVAPTHVALDNVLERIGCRPGVVALRLGEPDNVDERLHEYLIENRAASLGAALARRLDGALAGAPAEDPVVHVQRRWREAVAQSDTVGGLLLLNANLVCATPIGIAMSPEFRVPEPTFDVLIMDEASKATMTDFLVPATRARRWVLVGDHCQLAPYVDLDALAAVVGRRLKYHLGLPEMPPLYHREMIAEYLRRHFDQRMHPDPEVPARLWQKLVEVVTGDLDQAAPFTAVPPEEAAWSDLARVIEDAPQSLPGSLASLPPNAQQTIARTAGLMADLLAVQRVAMASVFERLLATLPSDRIVRFNYQHRMAPALARFSQAAVYDGDYESTASTRGLTLPIPTLEEPSIWIDTQQARPKCFEHPRDDEWRSGLYVNLYEVDKVVEVVHRCIAWAAESWTQDDGRPPRPFEIGVVAFYVKHALRLRDAIFRAHAEATNHHWRRRARRRAANGQSIDLHVSIVDRFQGQEKDVVVLSTARSNPVGYRGHVNNLNRLNVAVTRARYKRIIVGDAATLVFRRTGELRPENDLLVRLYGECERKLAWGKR